MKRGLKDKERPSYYKPKEFIEESFKSTNSFSDLSFLEKEGVEYG